MKRSGFATKARKPKPCKFCGKATTNKPSFCDFDCTIAQHKVNEQKKADKLVDEARKEFNRDIKRRKLNIKTRREWIKDLQVVFNRFVRTRDEVLGCISCGSRPNDSDLVKGSRWDAGHYRSVGANPELRFNEDNCHKQCVKCNRELSGNVTNYRINLIKRIGVERLEILEGHHKPLKLSIDEIKQQLQHYKNKIKELT